MKTPMAALLFAVVGLTLLAALALPPSLESFAISGAGQDVESNPWIVWEALNIFGQIFVDRQSIMTTEECTCRYSCGGLCPPCVAVRRAKVMGPFCSEDEAWANICSRMTDRGRYAIGSPCPWWVFVDGVKHTVDWNPWIACPKIGGEVVIPRPTCELPQPTATPTRTTTPTPTHAPEWDVAVDMIEITQAVQCMESYSGDQQCADNSIPLIQGKYTIVRVFPTVTVKEGEPTPTLYDFVGGALYLDSPATGSIEALNGAVPLGRDEDDIGIDRNVAYHSLNFLLPLEWTRNPAVRLRVNLEPARPISDTNPANNEQPINATFVEMPDMTVLYLPVRYQPPGAAEAIAPDENVMLSAAREIQDLYPLAEDGFYYRRGPKITFRGVLQGQDDQRLLRFLNLQYWLARLKNPAGAPDQLFGWLPADIPGFWFRAAADPAWAEPSGMSRVAYGRAVLELDGATWFPGRVVAHELAHNLNIGHPGTGDACGAQLYSIGDWPYDNAMLQETGYYPYAHVRSSGNSALLMTCCAIDWSNEDIMTYCPDTPNLTWVSPSVYRRLEGAIRDMKDWGVAPLAAAQDYLLVSGIVTKTGGASLDAVQKISSSDAPPTPVAGEDYCVHLQDGAGQTLRQWCFDAAFKGHDGSARNQDGFFYILPTAGAQRVSLWQQTTELAARSASAHAPVVSITAPLPGAVWDGAQTMRWTASDADGDSLTFSIIYSYDGSHWLPIDADLTETTYTLDTRDLPGGNGARIQVTANDGFLTTSAEVGPFSVTRKGPKVTIAAPENSTRFLLGQTVVLAGSGDDAEDGLLPETSLSWSSSIAGILGTGSLVQTSTLTAGDHRITLTGRDSSGMTATAAITLQVRLYRVELPIITKNALPAMPTATPTVPGCDLLFDESFAGASGGWTANGGQWSNPGGYLHAQSGPSVDAWNIKNSSISNVSYEGTVIIRQGSLAGLSLRTISGATGYDVNLDVNGGGVGVYKWPARTWIGWYSADIQRDRPYRLRVEARWGEMEIFLDGVQVLMVADGAFTTGNLGVHVYNSLADFDDLRACRLSVPYEMRVNAGGSIYTDTQGLFWFADQAYGAGNWGYEGSSLVGTSNDPVAGTEDDLLYRAMRWAYAPFSYKFDVPNGSYQVRLLFVEPTFTQGGKRTFDVQLEGQTVLANLDLFAVAGHDNAYSRVFSVAVSDGQLNASFVRKVENPLVSAIEVVGAAVSTPTATRTATATATLVRTATRTATATITRTATRTATVPAGSTATRTPTRPAWTVRLLDGDVRTFTRKPSVLAYANRLYVTPPSGVTLTDSGNVSPYYQWVFLMSAGQWIEASYSGSTTAIGVQFWGDNSDGWARVLVDGIEVWTGTTYAPIGQTYMKYLEISALPAGTHRLRVECMGVNGAGGFDDVVAYIFGFGTTTVQP